MAREHRLIEIIRDLTNIYDEYTSTDKAMIIEKVACFLVNDEKATALLEQALELSKQLDEEAWL